MVDSKIGTLPRDMAEVKSQLTATQAAVLELSKTSREHTKRLSELRSDMVEVKSDIAGLKSDMVEVKSDIKEIKNNTSNINSTLDGHEIRITAIETLK